MKIGVDISQIAYKGTGVSRFTKGLIDTILEYDKNNEWLFFFSSLRNQLKYEIAKNIKKKGFKILDFPFPPIFLSFLWNKHHIFKIDNLIKNLDWLITSDWIEPPSNFKKATIVHDLIYKRFPETLDSLIIKTQNKRLGHVKKESNLIFADSQSTKNDLINLMNIEDKRIVVNYPGVKILKTELDFDKQTLKKYQLNKTYVLSVGKIEPRKNIQRLIDAFLGLSLQNVELVIIGEYGWGPKIKKYENIRYLGYVNDNELFSIYKSSLFFVYPSLWEGFGYPVIEAMASGKAVATSNTSSLSEIVQDAALTFNPYKTSEIQHAIKTLLENKALREELVIKGKNTYKKFTWEDYYKTLIANLNTIK
ncbi:MAG: glycosyltransferase family 1 protein [bacterium]